MTFFIRLLGKAISKFSQTFHLGAGVTWTGEITLRLDPKIFPKLLPKNAKIILVAGTNGKTTTAKLLRHVLGSQVLHNETGANVLNGLVGSLIIGKVTDPKYVVLETDEATLPQVIKFLKFVKSEKYIILLNLFRDQLDRYGEVDTIANNWLLALKTLGTLKTTLIINADDPHLAWIGKNAKQKVLYFGLADKKYFLVQSPHATDSIFCPNCGTRMIFAGHYISHLGEYSCPKCNFAHPDVDLVSSSAQSPLTGVYNIYNVLAATLTAKVLGLKANFTDFSPAFGRQEEIGGAKILLSKNPAGFNESLRTVLDSPKKGPLLLVLNDRIPDGRDVSWIWDVDFEVLQNYQYPIYVSGDRKFDLALRLKYAEVPATIKEEFNVAWILPTYSAMLEVRKILTGKKIPQELS